MNRLITIMVYLISLCKLVTDEIISHPFQGTPMRYADVANETMDLFFDRIVTLVWSNSRTNRTILSIGALLERDLVLTSYNPIRTLRKTPDALQNVTVCFMNMRKQDGQGKFFYNYACATIKCGRPVIPMKREEISEEQWHGANKLHTPLHDLAVFKLDDLINVWDPPSNYTTENFDAIFPKGCELTKSGPTLTKLAAWKDRMKKDIKFCSIGLLTEQDAIRFVRLQVAYYEDRREVVVNCDEWLPRSWGYFICLWNDEKFFGFSSGSMLYSNGVLFGVGSFTIWRGRDSILVFTDIRYYLDQLMNTCSAREIGEPNQTNKTRKSTVL